MESPTLQPSHDPPERKPGGALSRQSPVLPDGSMPVPLGSGTITSVLGEGGAAIVYEIWVEKLGISRAVKVLKPNASDETTGRFETEMRITAQLRHPNIIEIHNVGEWHGQPFIEMEKIDGFSLDTLIHERGSLPLKICTAIGIIVCRALSFTHGHAYLVNGQKHVGILHRDLKPGNIMISRNGVVKLMDFGIATPQGVSLHTMEGSVIGSMQYIAPEQLEGSRSATARADIFSFGCVVYEMLTGQRTFPEKNMAQLVTARMKNAYRPLSEFKVKCPRSLSKLVNACLTLNPDKRIATVAEILRRLEKIHAKLSKNKPEDLVEYYISSNTGKSTVAFKRTPPYKKAAMAVAAACLIAGVVCLMYPARHSIKGLAEGLRSVWLSVPGKAPAARPPSTAGKAGAPGKPRLDPGQLSLPTLKTADREKMQTSGEIQSSGVANIMSMPAKDPWSAEALKSRADTGDPVAVLAKKTEKGDYAGALRAFDALDRESAAMVSARLYKLRALQGLGNKEALNAFFLRPDVPDKEYFLAKAQYFTALKRYIEAADQCEKGRQVPATIGDAAVLDRTLSYVKASCLTSHFMTAPTEDARKQAIDSWLEMKYLLRNNQGHPYFELADKNILLLTDQSKKTEP